MIKNLEQVYILRYSKKTKSPMWSKFWYMSIYTSSKSIFWEIPERQKLQDATKFFNMEKPQPKNWLKKFWPKWKFVWNLEKKPQNQFWCLIKVNKQNQRIQKSFQKIKTPNNNTFNFHITEYVSIYIYIYRLEYIFDHIGVCDQIGTATS